MRCFMTQQPESIRLTPSARYLRFESTMGLEEFDTYWSWHGFAVHDTVRSAVIKSKCCDVIGILIGN